MQLRPSSFDAPVSGQTVSAVAESHVDGWQIVEYREHEGQPTRYAALYRGQRRVWGLRDPQAVERWIERLTLPAQTELPLRPPGAGMAVAGSRR